MDLIVNRQLDRQEELAIYELTLKKQRSKKRSAVSEKNTIAMQRLAEELFQERKEFKCLNNNNGHHHHHQRQQQQQELTNIRLKSNLCRCHSDNSILPTTTTIATTATSTNSISTNRRNLLILKNEIDDNNLRGKSNQRKVDEEIEEENENAEDEEEQNNLVKLSSEIRGKKAIDLQRQSSTTSTIATSSSSTTSSSSSSKSSQSSESMMMMMRIHSHNHNNNNHSQLKHCPSSASSLQHQVEVEEAEAATRQQQQRHQNNDNLQTACTKSFSFLCTNNTSEPTSGNQQNLHNYNKIASIKLHKLRLDQLNNELERRLHQYEYLVAQEKAILGLHNMNLFTNEGVNNFHRFEIHKQKLQSSQSCGNIQLGQLKKF